LRVFYINCRAVVVRQVVDFKEKPLETKLQEVFGGEGGIRTTLHKLSIWGYFLANTTFDKKCLPRRNLKRLFASGGEGEIQSYTQKLYLPGFFLLFLR